ALPPAATPVKALSAPAPGKHPCHQEPSRAAQPRRAALPYRAALLCTAPTAPTAVFYATLATAPTAAMASPTVLTFDAEGRAVDFDVW
ncbi:unnamed protein product, partial [Closterium sp. NIES-54]